MSSVHIGIWKWKEKNVSSSSSYFFSPQFIDIFSSLKKIYIVAILSNSIFPMLIVRIDRATKLDQLLFLPIDQSFFRLWKLLPQWNENVRYGKAVIPIFLSRIQNPELTQTCVSEENSWKISLNKKSSKRAFHFFSSCSRFSHEVLFLFSRSYLFLLF